MANPEYQDLWPENGENDPTSILRLPIMIAGMIPQKEPMRVVNRLIKVAERTSVRVLGAARPDDRLDVHVHEYARLGGFGVVSGRIARNGEILATGEIKVGHKDDEAAERPKAGEEKGSGG